MVCRNALREKPRRAEQQRRDDKKDEALPVLLCHDFSGDSPA
jgi:hypothetical protein